MPTEEQLIDIYREVVNPKLKDWVIFNQGTCVIIYHHEGDVKAGAMEIMKKYGFATPGTSSADFTVLKVDNGWIVTGDQPGILNFVSEDEGKGKADFEIGLIGRSKKELDCKELKIIYTNIEVV